MIWRITGIILGVVAFLIVYWLSGGLATPATPNWALALLVGLVVALIWPWIMGLIVVRRAPAAPPERDRPGGPEAIGAAAEEPPGLLIPGPSALPA